MRTPQVLRLAQLDDQHFVMACGHGLIHLTWGRATIRMSRDEFRHMGRLLEQAGDEDAPAVSTTGQNIDLVSRADGASELRLSSLALILTPAELQNLSQVVRLALSQLDAFLAAGFWERKPPEDSYPHIWEETQRSSFSIN